MIIKNKKKNRGFTLIELMVSISIFSIIMLTALGSFVITVNVAKKARALRTAMDNVSFAMESMTRSIRMGTNYYCGTFDISDYNETSNSPIDGCPLISFIPFGGGFNARVGYQKKTGTNGKMTIMRFDSLNPSGVQIVSSDVTINTLNFFVNGNTPGDHIQPSVFIIMKGSVTVNGVTTPFDIQTLASQRNF
jgi:prepilin-type N-terminal cleavage/methylation domain-containing protein